MQVPAQAFQELCLTLKEKPRRFCVSGVAGFIGSNLLEKLLLLGQPVVGIDNFSTGSRSNLDDVRKTVGPALWKNFDLIEGDISEPAACNAACEDAEVLLHQAALGSVPRSIADPVTTHKSNVDGFIQMLVAAQKAQVGTIVYATSSSVYGDHPALPKFEDNIGKPLSPYAVTKRVNELYGQVFSDSYKMAIVGLRYFNVFGKRQDPNGPYAAVIPRWIDRMLAGQPCIIFGDGQTSRDFCYIDNIIQANLLAAVRGPEQHTIYNVGCNDRTTLLELHEELSKGVSSHTGKPALPPSFEPKRPGDVPHSQASIDKISTHLGYVPTHNVKQGLAEVVDWYTQNPRS